jgi:hypothetical protein
MFHLRFPFITTDSTRLRLRLRRGEQISETGSSLRFV